MKYLFLLNTLIAIASYGQNILGGSKTSIINTNHCNYKIFDGDGRCNSGNVLVSSTACCPETTPYYCSNTNSCYSTCEAASVACNGSVIKGYNCNYTKYNGYGRCNSGYVLVSNTACCPETTPYYCSNTNSCYGTCEAANNACDGYVIKGNSSNVQSFDNNQNYNINPNKNQNQIVIEPPTKGGMNTNQNISWSTELLHKIFKCKYCDKEYEEVLPIKIISNGNSEGDIGVLEASKMYPNQVGKTNFINQTCKGYNNPGYEHQLVEVSKFKSTEYRTATNSDALDVQNHIKSNFNEIERSIFVNQCIKVAIIAIAAGK